MRALKFNKFNKLLFFIIYVCLFAGIGAVITFMASVSAQTPNDSLAPELNKSYAINTRLEIPDYTFTIDKTEILAQPFVYYPDGRLYSCKIITLDIAGMYRLEYRATHNSETLSNECYFKVYDNLFTLSGSNTGVSRTSLKYGKHTFNDNGEQEGIIFEMQSNVDVQFNRIIDLSKSTINDELVKFFIIPTTIGEADFTSVKLTFTDIYDSTNTMTILVRCSPDAPPSGGNTVYSISYIKAAGKDQLLSGEEHRGLIWRYPANYGTMYYCDFGNKISAQFRLKMDYKNLAVYAGNQFIIDFDNPDNFSTMWQGFTTGEVYLKMSVDGVKKDCARLMVSDVYGITSDELFEMRIDSNSAPTIEIDTKGYSIDSLPNGKINIPYKLFSARAVNNNGVELVATPSVFLGYGTTSQIELPIVDGKFTPFCAQKHTLVYTAFDYWGNKSVKTVDIDIRKQVDPIMINISNKKIISGRIGESISTAVYAISGGCGKINVNTQVFDESNKAITLKDGKFRPLKKGKYKVNYTAVDYIGQSTVVGYSVNIDEASDAVFEKAPIFERYYIVGKQYVLPLWEAYNYSSGVATAVTCDVYVKEGDKPEVKLKTDLKYTFIQEGNATIRYCRGDSEISYNVKTLSIYDSDGFFSDLRKYFVNDSGVTMTLKKESLLVSSSVDGGTSFINKLLASGMFLRFTAVPEKSNYKKLNVTLTDSADSSVQLKLTFAAKGNKATVSLNGGRSIDIRSGFTNQSLSNNFELTFLNNKFTFDVDASLSVVNDLCGNPFNGFLSNYVYVDLDFEKVKEQVDLKLTNISGVELNSYTNIGSSSPRIILLDKFGGEKQINTVQSISRAIAADVLDPCVNFKVSVYDYESKIVDDINGLKLENVDPMQLYKINLSKYGFYRVSYTAYNFNNERPEVAEYVIMVVDRVAPELIFDGNPPTQVTLGSNVVLPNFIVSDNVTKAENIVVRWQLISPCGRVEYFEKGSNSFVAKQKGIYKVMYTVLDKENNARFVKFKITVV